MQYDSKLVGEIMGNRHSHTLLMGIQTKCNPSGGDFDKATDVPTLLPSNLTSSSLP